MDGVDVALIETDGQTQVRAVPGASHTISYSNAERDVLFKAVDTALHIDAPEAVSHPDLIAAADISTVRHIQALQILLGRLEKPVDVIGYHGQTVLHRPNPLDPALAFTVQLGDAERLTRETGVTTVYDFRSADVTAGGQGAPLAPLYHQALLTSTAELPAIILNLGGIANITFVPDADPENLIAADIGPANVFMDDLVRTETGKAYDEEGALAASGAVDTLLVEQFFSAPYFQEAGPKSLDRYGLEAPDVSALGLADAMATLAELTIESVVRAIGGLPQPPKAVFVAGGGVKNTYLMAQMQARLASPVLPLNDLGFSAAMLEAEAFAYLAARHLKGLPITFPSTTGVHAPMLGGKRIRSA